MDRGQGNEKYNRDYRHIDREVKMEDDVNRSYGLYTIRIGVIPKYGIRL